MPGISHPWIEHRKYLTSIASVPGNCRAMVLFERPGILRCQHSTELLATNMASNIGATNRRHFSANIE